MLKFHSVRVLTLAVAGVIASLPALSLGATYTFNTSNSTLSQDTTVVNSINGTRFTVANVDGVTQFRFAGDLTFQTGDTINVVGNAPISLLAGNNLTLPAGVTINVSAAGTTTGVGGAVAQSGGAGGTTVAGGTGFVGTPGGFGGNGGSPFSSGGTGSTGLNGIDGTSGANGTAGSDGNVGGQAFNNTGTGAVGAHGLAGTGAGGGAGGAGGSPGSGGAFTASTNYAGDPGGAGAAGGNGSNGTAGTGGGTGGDGSNLTTGLVISGGSAGGSGAGGGSGGGGGGGGSGGGGGGAGGGAGSVFHSGGDGGSGGLGGNAAFGGNGAIGGAGGAGGAGGGAIELLAYGRLTVDGNLLATGAPGAPGVAGHTGTYYPADHSTTGTGTAGQAGGSSAGDTASPGGDGGDGGNGGDGGYGGPGGAGGHGGAGSGGTVKLDASVVITSGASVNTSGGDSSVASNGRFILAANNSATAPTLTGARTETFTGFTNTNRYLTSSAATPRIPDLVGGAEAFGLLANLDATNAFFAAAKNGAPAGALGALIVAAAGAPGYTDEFPGYDLVLLVNFDSALKDPLIGFDENSTDPSFMRPLVEGGYMTTSAFGDHAYTTLSALDPNAIYAFLVPDSDLLNGQFHVSADGATPLDAAMQFGGVSYLTAAVPEPASLTLCIAGIALLLVQRRRKTPPRKPA